MTTGYFYRVHKETPTRFWVNNPSGQEMTQAIAAGAINATTNPAYCSKLIKIELEYIRGIIDCAIKEIRDDNIAADWVYQKAASRVMDRFLPLYEQSKANYGYVTIQADPREDKNPDLIVKAALRHQRLGKNYMAKIPVILAGTHAIEDCIKRKIPICATEVFAISQAIQVCELHERATKGCGNSAPFYVTHITGIFDEYLKRIVEHQQINIEQDILMQAGITIARKQYRMLRERGYRVKMLGGGARGIHHFTEMVGGDVHITINWNTAQELIEADGTVVSRIDEETPKAVIDELSMKLPDFSKAFQVDGLRLEEFEEFGPVKMFRNNFVEGYYLLLAEIAAIRALNP